MNKIKILKEVEKKVRQKMDGEGTGHDWWHIDRVRKNALEIAKKEKADTFVVELGALLHDIADFKFHNGNESIGPKTAEKILKSAGANSDIIEKIKHIVENVSFKGAGIINKIKTLEGKVVQDADRLDAIGAIGIARAFAYGGWKQRPVYNPDGRVKKHKTPKEYIKHFADSTVHHFYEKLLLLKDRMNTKTGKKLALHRHRFIENYLKHFFKEWNGKK
ncbi:MAG: HD domain-containing protein [Patescibacteria group bacterium]